MSDTAGRKIGYLELTAIGIGGMVGGGIFAVLGLAVQLAKGATPLAFIIAGAVALITTYSYKTLSVAFPSKGGTVTFIDRAFGTDFFTGGMNILLWLSYIIMISLYAFAFGSYGAALLPGPINPLSKHILISGIIIVITVLNLLNAETVAKAELWIVTLKAVILCVFIAVGVGLIDVDRLKPVEWTPPLQLVAGGMVIFLAYEGFELIANAAEDVRDYRKILPRAYYSAVIFVIVLYVLIAAVTVGSLPAERIIASKDYALAEAAKPSMGGFGFKLIAVAAVLSTASAINATLYGAARLSYVVAKEGELPKWLERKIWKEPVEGLLITAAIALLTANLLNLSSISTIGSGGFLLIFAAVNGANALLHKKTKSNPFISVVGVIICLGALFTLVWQTAVTIPADLWFLVGMVGVSFAIEFIYRSVKRRRFNLRGPEH
jgi:amino acid transporter